MSQPDPTMQVQRGDGTWADLTLSGYLPLVEAAEKALEALEHPVDGLEVTTPTTRALRAALAAARAS